MNRIKIVLIVLIGLAQFSFMNAEQQKPNVLVIMVDQQFADAMSCVMGDKYIHTPNMDALVEQGMQFTRAYSPNPLCVPMRTSMMTGMFPHETGILSNKEKVATEEMSNFNFLGKLFKEAGYETAYFGKWHVALSASEKDIHGFDIMNSKGILNAKPVSDFINEKHEKPFLAFSSFLSPHEICQWARKQDLPGGPIVQLPPLNELPPLKTNFFPPQNETDIMSYIRKSFQATPTFPLSDYTYEDYRRLQWGYYRLIERADSLTGEVLNALKKSGLEESTLVVFLSDHGDCAGSHHFNQKTVFYDESVRVPFIVMWKGKIVKGSSDILINTGIDLIPTLCDFAGIKVPASLPGKSIMPVAMGEKINWQRDYIVSENYLTQGNPIDGVSLKPQGRMVRSKDFKYCIYNEGVERESLVDMKHDPLEMVNQAKNSLYKDVLEQHREYLRDHAEKNKDLMALKMLEELKK